MLTKAAQHILPYLSARRWLVGFSGGLDSTVLLHFLAHLPQRPPITAIYIHHGLQAQADDWLVHCRHIAQVLNVDFQAFFVAVDSTKNVEENARLARYQQFTRELEENECLMLAHHGDDQAETLLYRLLRGSGVRGAAAMPRQRALGKGLLLRPFLSVPRAELARYAQQQQLSYVDDPSNKDAVYDRNFLRLAIFPLLKKRFPAVSEKFTQFTQHIVEAQSLLDEVAQQDLPHCLAQNQGFALAPWQMLSTARQGNVLRYWFYQHGYTLSEMQYQQVLQIIAAKADAQPQMDFSMHSLRRYQQVLYLTSKSISFAPFTWQTRAPCFIEGLGYYALSQARDLSLEVKMREGGEQILLPHRTQHKKLKQLLREQAIAPWLRDLLPLFYHQGQLIAVGEYFVSVQGEALLAGAKIVYRPN